MVSENTLEKLNRLYGDKIRGEMGVKKGNDFIRKMAEEKDRCKYPAFGTDILSPK